MVTVQRWSGREARLLRDALRMSLRDFAAYLGVSHRTASNWEGDGASYQPRAESQAVLDAALGRASEDAKARFAAAPGMSEAVGSVAGQIEVDSHKFLPVFIGVERSRLLRAHMTPSGDDQWLEFGCAPWVVTDACASDAGPDVGLLVARRLIGTGQLVTAENVMSQLTAYTGTPVLE
ncbi:MULTISPECIES: helix-turn-helix domain-containing protein [unclassified Streptomyces]|uniref:helix-turn-helix domain-containing protein n=1 Tax=unclassified Streptomyces TaxID=2593676 RepID=UPI0037F4E466